MRNDIKKLKDAKKEKIIDKILKLQNVSGRKD